MRVVWLVTKCSARTLRKVIVTTLTRDLNNHTVRHIRHVAFNHGRPLILEWHVAPIYGT